MNETTVTARVMSFNIRTSTARDFRHAWDLRKHLVIKRIRAFDPDLLGLQECQDGEQANFIQEQLPDYEFIATHRGSDTRAGREMAPLMFRREAYDLLDSGHFWLSRTPQEKGSRLLGAVFPRTATWARLRPRAAPEQEIYFFNTHFDYIPLILPTAAQILREHILHIAGGEPTVLCGDFNTPAGGSAYRLLTGEDAGESAEPDQQLRLLDVSLNSRTTSGEAAGTIHKFGLINRPLIIDWILASSHFNVSDALIDDFNDNGLYPSDHYPVTAVLHAQWVSRGGG